MHGLVFNHHVIWRFALLGTEWVMWLLVVMGFVALVLFFVRLYFFNRYSVDVDQLLTRLNRSWIEACERADEQPD